MNNSRFFRAAIFGVCAVALSACGDKDAAAPSAAAGGGAPPPEVAVVIVNPQALTLTTELPGRVEATRVAQVRARVPGIVLRQVFKDGTDVKAGQVLFRIDPAPLEALVANAQAAVSRAEANLAQAKLRVERYEPLVKINAVSKQDYDDAVSAQKLAAADVAGAQAQLRTARLNLGYATVTAPISGRIGRAQVTEGALVGQGEATLLATIQQIDPVWVTVSQSSSDVLRLREALASGQLQSVQPGQAKVTLATEDGSPYPQSGRLQFSDLTVDPTTGAVSVRAEFPNPRRMLLPGMYVRARLEQGVNQAAITVPQQAIVRTSRGASVMVVDAAGKVSVQTVTTGRSEGSRIVVLQGLKAGDQVIVEGIQKAQPGATVKAVPWQSDNSAPAAVPSK